MQSRSSQFGANERPTLDSMLDEVLVVCPHCGSCARVAPIAVERISLFTQRRLICKKCGLVKSWEGNAVRYPARDAPPFDPYFQLPLWLSASCCGHRLWFFNRRHMGLIEEYVRAGLRENRQHPQYGWHNQSLFNRLPKFIKEAKHRDEILGAIEKLGHKG